MDKDIDVRDVLSSCRRLNFDKENNESDLLPNENTNEEKRDEFSNLEDGEKTTDNHHLISEAKIPRIGMEFESEAAAYQFYNKYAYEIGFSIRRTTIHKDNNENIIDRTLCCSCEDQRGQDKRDVNVKSHRPETRTYCCARMRISARHKGKYTVVKFVVDHNGHIPVSPDKSYLLRSHRTITSQQAVQIIDIRKSGIPPKAGLDYMAQPAGGRENVGFLLGDLRNYLHSKRTMQMKEGDAGGILNYLQLKQLDDPNFFHAVQLDIDDLITNIFWTDGRMIADYIDILGM